jgi:hypothetical protein
MDPEEFHAEESLIGDLRKKNIRALMQLYISYADDLSIYAYTQLNNAGLAVRTVDKFFEDLWTSDRFSDITPPVYKYLLNQIQEICAKKG